MTEDAVFNIVIVDDTPANLKLLEGMLRERGYQVRAFPRGRLALAAVTQNPPDLILLDVNMPEMTGYEVCEKLKADPALRAIPVLFISAMSETMDKVKAFVSGGVDYITKPFQFEEVEARVRTHLELHRQRRQLQASYDQLHALEKLRDNLTHMIVHDMRSPLGNILIALELLKKSYPVAGGECARLLNSAEGSASTMVHMVTQLLDIGRLEASQMPLNKTVCDVGASAKAVIESLSATTRGRHVFFLETGGPVLAVCDIDILQRIIRNLLENAIKFTPPEGRVSISVSLDGAGARLVVSDTGPGIPAQYHQKIFEKFGQVEGEKTRFGNGLGLTFCKLAVQAHGGQIGVQSEVGKGSSFWVVLPSSV